MHGSRIKTIQLKLDQCKSESQDAVKSKKELDSCRDELTDERNSKEQIYQDFQSSKQNIKTLEDENKRHNRSMRSANRNIETLKDEKKVLQNQLNSEKAENDNLRNQIRQLKNERNNEERNLNNQNQNLQKRPLYTYTDLWHENFANEEYVIAYEINPWLDNKLQRMIPKVSLEFRVTFIRFESFISGRTGQMIIKLMELVQPPFEYKKLIISGHGKN